MSRTLIYLASPYSHPDTEVMEERFNQSRLFAARAVKAGHNVYSPIVHSHMLAQALELPRTWDFWKAHDIPMLLRCDVLWVLALPGWKISRGVTEEIQAAKDKPIVFYSIDYNFDEEGD
jgi:hypothetical protein